jgi:hypothetical protein
VAVREFSDERGVEWRVWDVVPGRLTPGMLSQEISSRYGQGWLAFESGKDEKRRLPAPYPRDWHRLPLRELLTLAKKASAVPNLAKRAQEQKKTPSGEYRKFAADADERALREALRDGQRSFTSPRGKTWTVRLHERLGVDGDPEAVLRFTCGDTVLDLRPWPTDWGDCPPAELAKLVLDAEPPLVPTSVRRPRRRREDHAY